MLIIGAFTEPNESRIQICPVEAKEDKGKELGGKKDPVIVPLIFARGIFDK